jgi:hypothetical protein
VRPCHGTPVGVGFHAPWLHGLATLSFQARSWHPDAMPGWLPPLLAPEPGGVPASRCVPEEGDRRHSLDCACIACEFRLPRVRGPCEERGPGLVWCHPVGSLPEGGEEAGEGGTVALLPRGRTRWLTWAWSRRWGRGPGSPATTVSVPGIDRPAAGPAVPSRVTETLDCSGGGQSTASFRVFPGLDLRLPVRTAASSLGVRCVVGLGFRSPFDTWVPRRASRGCCAGFPFSSPAKLRCSVSFVVPFLPARPPALRVAGRGPARGVFLWKHVCPWRKGGR